MIVEIILQTNFLVRAYIDQIFQFLPRFILLLEHVNLLTALHPRLLTHLFLLHLLKRLLIPLHTLKYRPNIIPILIRLIRTRPLLLGLFRRLVFALYHHLRVIHGITGYSFLHLPTGSSSVFRCVIFPSIPYRVYTHEIIDFSPLSSALSQPTPRLKAFIPCYYILHSLL